MRKIVNKPEVKSFIFFCLLLIPSFFLCYGNGIQNFVFFIAVAAMLLTSVIEVPIYRMKTKKPEYSEREAMRIGEIYHAPIAEEMREGDKRTYRTTVTLNMGGFIIPLLFSFYLLKSYSLPLIEVIMSSLLMVLFSYMLLEVKGGIGIVVPSYIGIFAIPLGFLLAPEPEIVAPLIFVSAIFGIALGMLLSLVKLPREEVGSAFFNIGGIGSFHSVYIISFLALLIGSIG
jgi:uncharacterized membrane protein